MRLILSPIFFLTTLVAPAQWKANLGINIPPVISKSTALFPAATVGFQHHLSRFLKLTGVFKNRLFFEETIIWEACSVITNLALARLNRIHLSGISREFFR